MVIDAKVLKIENEKTLYGILDQNGQCGTGSCGGCNCSTKLKTITLPTDREHPVDVGMDVEIHQNRNYLFHFALIIILPLLVLAGFHMIPSISSWNPEKSLLNGLSLVAGLSTFVLSSVLVSLFRDKHSVLIVPKEKSQQ